MIIYDVQFDKNSYFLDAGLAKTETEISIDFFDVLSFALDADMEKTETEISVEFGAVTTIESVNIPIYTGTYTVTPKTEAQVMQTANKKMLDDVSIREIPFYRVGNDTGDTVYIGRDIHAD